MHLLPWKGIVRGFVRLSFLGNVLLFATFFLELHVIGMDSVQEHIEQRRVKMELKTNFLRRKPSE